MKVFVTGGTGFVGGEVIRHLVAAGHEVRALARASARARATQLPPGVTRAEGDILDPDLAKHLDGVNAVVHLVGIIREAPPAVTFERLHFEATANVLRAMQAAGVSRLVHMSALGAGPDSTTGYFKTKWRAETAVRESGLRWTVMKPSVIHGPGDEFLNMLADQVRRLPVVPVIGDGEYRLQPVAVADVAEGFTRALTLPAAEGRVFEVGGPRQYTYNELLDAVAARIGRKPPVKVHVPLGLMRPVIRALEGFSFFPITGDQLAMLLMNNVCDPGPFYQALGIPPSPLDTGNQ